MKYKLTIECENVKELRSISNTVTQNSDKLPSCKSRLSLIRDIKNLFRQYSDPGPTLIELKSLVYKHVN